MRKKPKEEYGFIEADCPICGKHFCKSATISQYVYKKHPKGKSDGWEFFCSYTCYCIAKGYTKKKEDR